MRFAAGCDDFVELFWRGVACLCRHRHRPPAPSRVVVGVAVNLGLFLIHRYQIALTLEALWISCVHMKVVMHIADRFTVFS